MHIAKNNSRIIKHTYEIPRNEPIAAPKYKKEEQGIQLKWGVGREIIATLAINVRQKRNISLIIPSVVRMRMHTCGSRKRR